MAEERFPLAGEAHSFDPDDSRLFKRLGCAAENLVRVTCPVRTIWLLSDAEKETVIDCPGYFSPA